MKTNELSRISEIQFMYLITFPTWGIKQLPLQQFVFVHILVMRLPHYLPSI